MSEERYIVKKTLWSNYAIIVLILFFGSFGVYERRTNTADIKQTTLMQRSMLNARARIQIILLNANLEGRKLTPQEVDEIGRLWKAADYDRVAAAEEK